MTGDVLGHHDCVVDHEAGRDGERHQGEIVEAEPQEIHYREGTGEGERRREARNEGGARIAQKQENHQHDEQSREHKRPFDIAHRGADRYGAIGQHGGIGAWRQCRLEARQRRLDGVHHGNDIGAGLPLNIEDDGGLDARPGGKLFILGALGDRGDVGEPDRRAVPVGDDEVPVIGDALQLIIGIDRISPLQAVESSLGAIDIGIGDGGAQIIEIEAIGGDRARIDFDAHRRPLAATEAHDPDARHLRNLLGKPRVGEFLDLCQRQGL